MLRPISCVEQQLGYGRWCVIFRCMQQELSDRPAKGCSTGFSGPQKPSIVWHQTRCGEPPNQMLQLRGLATSIDAFQDDETSLHLIRSASALSTTVIELSAISSAAKGGESSNP